MNMLLPPEERTLTPPEVEALDQRRRRGHVLLNLGFQFGIVAILVTMWSGQDLQYSPGWAHPMIYWDCFVGLISFVCIVLGIHLRRGMNEFFSY